MLEQHEQRYAQHTVRATVSSGNARISSDAEMVVRNPAPDASPPSTPTGTSFSFTLSSGNRF